MNILLTLAQTLHKQAGGNIESSVGTTVVILRNPISLSLEKRRSMGQLKRDK